MVEENRFLAARDDMEAVFIDLASGDRLPAVAQLELALDACRDHAEQVSCELELAALPLLAAQDGAARRLPTFVRAICNRSPPGSPARVARTCRSDSSGALSPGSPVRERRRKDHQL